MVRSRNASKKISLLPTEIFCSPAYSSSENLMSVISWVLIGPYLNFCSLMSPTFCNSPQKCAPVKWKVSQKAGYQFVTKTTSQMKFFIHMLNLQKIYILILIPNIFWLKKLTLIFTFKYNFLLLFLE